MNLSDMVTQICADTGYVDDDDQRFARTALRQRDDLLWRMGLWKDSLIQVNVPVDPVTNEDHAEGIIYLPEVIERVVGVRTADQWLRVSGLETFYRVDVDKFAATGSPVDFAKLAPGWFTWRGMLGLQIASDATDDGKQIKVLWRDSHGRRYTQPITLAAAAGLTLQDSPLTNTVILSGASSGYDLDGIYVWDGTKFDAAGNVGANWTIQYHEFNGTTAWYVLSGDGSHVFQSLAGVLGPYTDLVAGAAGAIPSVAYGVKTTISVEAMYKPVTAGAVALNPQLFGDPAGASLLAAETKSPTYQRIRIFPIPSAAGGLMVLGKAAYVPLDFDEMEPRITGSHLALMAFAKHLLLKRGGENGTALDAVQEAIGLLDTLKKEELIQEANNQRIIPDSGYGDAYFGPGGWVG